MLTDIASGWTECAPLVVRESTLLVEALERIRIGLPFALRALDVDNGSEFINETLIQYCLRNGIELIRSRPYRVALHVKPDKMPELERETFTA